MKRPSMLAVLASLAVAAAGAAPAAAADPPSPSGPPSPSAASGIPVAGLTPGETISPSLAEASGPVTAFVQLDAPSAVEVAQGGGDTADVGAAREQVTELADDVVPQQATQRSARAAGAPQQLSVTSNLLAGVVVTGDAAQVRGLADADRVTAVYRIVPKTLANKGTDAFTQALATWQSTGRTGEGVRVGIIDTGLDYTHATFGGPGTVSAYDEAYGTDGTAPIPAGSYDPAKYLGGHDFAGPTYDASGEVPGSSLVPVPDENPIDAPFGHGSHVAGTTAGYGVGPDGTTFEGDYTTLTDLADWQIGPGSAPEAGIYSLKVFGDVGGSTSLAIDALEWAADPNDDGNLDDRLDIVNLSLGADASPADDPENLFIDELASLGTLAVVASGNAGDVTDIGGAPGNARTSLTVANSVGSTLTYDAVQVLAASDPEVIGKHAAQSSQNYTGGVDVTAEVAFLGPDVTGCEPLTPEQAAATDGKIAFLSWDDDDTSPGWCGSAPRFDNAEAAGAVGVLLPSELDVFEAGIGGNATIPGAQLTGTSYDALRGAIEAGGLVLTMGPSLANDSVVQDDPLGDTLNSSSSRGVHGSLGIVKPDVAAPGTSIASAAAGTGNAPTVKSGTSMSTPHVAGIAALVLEEHPTWSVQEVKAAVMNTATHDVFTGPSGTGTVYGPERVGSGRVDALDAVSSPVLAYSTEDPALVSVTFGIVPVGADPVALSRQVTVENTGTTPVTYDTSFAQASTTGEAGVSVTPAQVTVAAGQTQTLTVTLEADPATLSKDLDPTSEEIQADLPRDFVSMVSGRVILEPVTEGFTELRVPVQAAVKPVSDLSARPVVFADGETEADLTLEGRGVDQGGWLSLVAPFELKVTSPQLDASAAEGTSASAVGQGDIRAVGFASTAPQLAAAGGEPSEGTIGIGISTYGEWASLGAKVYPAVTTDVDGDGDPEFETQVQKYPDADVTVAATFALKDDPDGDWAAGDNIDLNPINSVLASIDTSVFDNSVMVVPINLDMLKIGIGQTPTFQVSTISEYATGPDQLIDTTEPFIADPFDPAYWFEGGNSGSLLFVGEPGAAVTVHRSASAVETGSGELLLLHLHNGTPAERSQVVGVNAPVAGPDVTVETRAQCMGAKAYVAVRALNADDIPVDITLTTLYGTKSFNQVAPGKSAYQSFNARVTTLEAGTVTVTATAVIDGETVTVPIEGMYGAASCGVS